MRFALFYEIPVPRPWDADSERIAYQNTIEQAVLGDKVGFDAFWTVDYFLTSNVALNLAQRYFVTPRGHSSPIFETWGLAGLNGGRSETSVRLTYQF